MSFNGIIFDLDGTLYAMTKKARLTTFVNCIPHQKYFFKYLKVRHSLQGFDFTTEVKLKSEIKKLLSKAGIPDNFEEEVFYPAFTKMLRANRNRSQLIDFIKHCKNLGVKTAVLSDYGIIDERIEALGYNKEMFDYRYSSEDFGAFKPCSRIFGKVVESMGLSASTVLMVGDRDDTDGKGAVSVGMPFFKLCGNSNRGFKEKLKVLYAFMQTTVAVPVLRLPHNPDLLLPQRMTLFSSGADIRAANKDAIILEPNQRQLIPSGLIFETPVGYEIQIRPRSGLALKHGITVLNSPGTIDSDYRGEVFVLLVNLSSEPFIITRGERIAQAVISKTAAVNFKEKSSVSKTVRGDGGFGHTGR